VRQVVKKEKRQKEFDKPHKPHKTRNRMKNKKLRNRSLLPTQAARFLAGTVTARFTTFAGSIARPGDTCPITTIDADCYDGGHSVIPLATVTITEVLPAAIDSDFLIVGQSRMAPDSPEAIAFASDCGFSSFASLVESFAGRLPFVGHVIRWAPYGQTAPQTVEAMSGQAQALTPA
jgi:hypothetical protein